MNVADGWLSPHEDAKPRSREEGKPTYGEAGIVISEDGVTVKDVQ